MYIAVARSYYGPSLHAPFPIAYLMLRLGPEDFQLRPDSARDHAVRLIEATTPLAASEYLKDAFRLIVDATARWSEDGLPAMFDSALQRVADFIGETIYSKRIRLSQYSETLELFLHSGDAEVGRRIATFAVDALNASNANLTLLPECIKSLLADLDACHRYATSRRPTLTQAAILAIAAERSIPAIRFDRWPVLPENVEAPPKQQGMMQLGFGKYGKRLLETATSAVQPGIHDLLADRVAMHNLLRSNAVPVPQRDPEFTNIHTLQRAVRSAQRTGYPVVLKPRRSARGVGVTQQLRTEEELISAFADTVRHDRQLIVERYIEGLSYRLLMIGGEIIHIRRGLVGVEQSAASMNHSCALSELCLDVKKAAIRAADCFDLPVAAVDIITSDPTIPLETSGGAVVRVDAAPDLGLHLTDQESIPLYAARHFLAYLIPEGIASRIPLAAITGTKGKTTTCRMAARILAETGYTVGLACSDGVFVGSEAITRNTSSGITGALHLFSDRRVELAVVEISRGTLVQRGLGFDCAEIGVCTNVSADHIGLDGIDSVEAMARVKAVVVERALDFAIVNADCPFSLAMLQNSRAKHRCLVAPTKTRPTLDSHLAAGGLAIVLEGVSGTATITLRSGRNRESLLPVSAIPATWGGAAKHNVENAMFAATVGIAMGADLSTVRRGLSTFEASLHDSPGRINRYDGLPFMVIVDAGATGPGCRALCDFVDRLSRYQRKILVFHGLGDRRDEDLSAMAQRAARSFDLFFCWDFTPLRGRQPGEVPGLLARALESEGVHSERIRVCVGLESAFGQAAAVAGEGDLVVIVSAGWHGEIFRYLEGFKMQHRQQPCSKD
ncbi:MAG: hypothetical protein KA142_01365 [Chromatiaceae bacterium]|nr:hypothetical protein [Chromatiaceae bacterium]